VTRRLPRVAPNEVLEVPGTGLSIPPGTKISMDSASVHQNPKLFPRPLQYQSERWLQNPLLDRYLVTFSKGARQCVGINLAYAEIYMALGVIFARFPTSDDSPRLQLVTPTTGLAETELAGDFFVPATKSGCKNVRFIFSRDFCLSCQRPLFFFPLLRPH
jgi:cytochrome P450